jgi:hypothetical protein
MSFCDRGTSTTWILDKRLAWYFYVTCCDDCARSEDSRILLQLDATLVELGVISWSF